MTDLYIALGCLACTILAIVFTSAVKNIAKAIIKKKGKAYNKKVWEYPLWAVGFVTAFGGVFAFLYFYVGNRDYIYIIKTSFTFAAAVDTVYMLVIQLARKGFSGCISFCKKLAASKNPVADLTAIAKETVLENATADEKAQIAKNDAKKEEVKTKVSEIEEAAKKLYSSVIAPKK